MVLALHYGVPSLERVVTIIPQAAQGVGTRTANKYPLDFLLLESLSRVFCT